jgi:hypothetical protein
LFIYMIQVLSYLFSKYFLAHLDNRGRGQALANLEL